MAHTEYDFGDFDSYIEAAISAVPHERNSAESDRETQLRIDVFVSGDKQVDIVRTVASDMGLSFEGLATVWLGEYAHVLRVAGERGKTVHAFEIIVKALKRRGDFDSLVHEVASGYAVDDQIYSNWIG